MGRVGLVGGFGGRVLRFECEVNSELVLSAATCVRARTCIDDC